nr:ABC transporter permease [Lachnospiraceae bacterium]
YITGIIMMAWQYLSPVMYDMNMIPEKARKFFEFNPMTSVLTVYRDIFYYKQAPHMRSLLMSLFMGVFFLIVGVLAFGKMKKHFSEEL